MELWFILYCLHGFFGILVYYHLDMITQTIAFFEPANLLSSINSFVEKYDSPTLLTVVVVGITGLYLYIRFFSNIRENYFEGDMGGYLQFYETLFSMIFDISVLGILFLYLGFVKQAYWEFAISALVIIGLQISISLMYPHYFRIIRNYSAIESMNITLQKIRDRMRRELLTKPDGIADLILYVFLENTQVPIAISFFFTIIVIMVGIGSGFNTLTIIVLVLIIIRYALFQSQIGSIPKNLLTLYLTSGQIYNRVFVIKESQDFVTIINQDDLLLLISKPQIKIIEPIVEPENIR
jgi:hypothetical protein